MERIRNKNLSLRAQASLELSISLICVFLLLFASFNIFLWVSQRIVHRQQDYEGGLTGRLVAGTIGSFFGSVEPNEANEARYPKLDIFGGNN